VHRTDIEIGGQLSGLPSGFNSRPEHHRLGYSSHPGCPQLQEISIVPFASSQYWLQ
jgi:hypothetical protein